MSKKSNTPPADPEPVVEEPVVYDPHALDARVIEVLEEFELDDNFRLSRAAELILRRASSDTPAADLVKARWYLDQEIDRLHRAE